MELEYQRFNNGITNFTISYERGRNFFVPIRIQEYTPPLNGTLEVVEMEQFFLKPR